MPLSAATALLISPAAAAAQRRRAQLAKGSPQVRWRVASSLPEHTLPLCTPTSCAHVCTQVLMRTYMCTCMHVLMRVTFLFKR